MQGLRCHFISMSAKSPTKLKVMSRHDHSCLLGHKASNQANKPMTQYPHIILQTLNKEQGIHWIKAERLPAFLESDLYLEYRLSKLLSQARITGEHGEYVLMKIHFKPKLKKVSVH